MRRSTNPPPPPPQTPFPEGVPYTLGHFGLYRSLAGHLPVRLLFNDWDILWVREGRVRLEFRNANLEGDHDTFLVIPPCQSLLVHEQRPRLAFYYCHLQFLDVRRDLFGNRAETSLTALLGPGPTLQLPLVFKAREAPQVARAYRRLVARRAEPGTPWQLQQSALGLAQALAALAKRWSRNLPAPPGGGPLEIPRKPDGRVLRLTRQIEEDPGFDWRVGELARAVGLSTGHLNALCRQDLGKSLKQLIVQTRLRLALRLLKERREGAQRSVREISEACGFSSQHFFSRQFKKHFRIGPLAYRNGATLES